MKISKNSKIALGAWNFLEGFFLSQSLFWETRIDVSTPERMIFLHIRVSNAESYISTGPVRILNYGNSNSPKNQLKQLKVWPGTPDNFRSRMIWMPAIFEFQGTYLWHFSVRYSYEYNMSESRRHSFHTTCFTLVLPVVGFWKTARLLFEKFPLYVENNILPSNLEKFRSPKKFEFVVFYNITFPRLKKLVLCLQ